MMVVLKPPNPIWCLYLHSLMCQTPELPRLSHTCLTKRACCRGRKFPSRSLGLAGWCMLTQCVVCPCGWTQSLALCGVAIPRWEPALRKRLVECLRSAKKRGSPRLLQLLQVRVAERCDSTGRRKATSLFAPHSVVLVDVPPHPLGSFLVHVYVYVWVGVVSQSRRAQHAQVKRHLSQLSDRDAQFRSTTRGLFALCVQALQAMCVITSELPCGLVVCPRLI